MRTMSAPASAQACTCSTVAFTSVVSVLVIVCTVIGASPPTGTGPTWIWRVLRRSILRHGRMGLCDMSGLSETVPVDAPRIDLSGALDNVRSVIRSDSPAPPGFCLLRRRPGPVPPLRGRSGSAPATAMAKFALSASADSSTSRTIDAPVPAGPASRRSPRSRASRNCPTAEAAAHRFRAAPSCRPRSACPSKSVVPFAEVIWIQVGRTAKTRTSSSSQPRSPAPASAAPPALPGAPRPAPSCRPPGATC
jgi:hypothetical protein